MCIGQPNGKGGGLQVLLGNPWERMQQELSPHGSRGGGQLSERPVQVVETHPGIKEGQMTSDDGSVSKQLLGSASVAFVVALPLTHPPRSS